MVRGVGAVDDLLVNRKGVSKSLAASRQRLSDSRLRPTAEEESPVDLMMDRSRGKLVQAFKGNHLKQWHADEALQLYDQLNECI